MKRLSILLLLLISNNNYAQILQNITLKAGGGWALQSKSPDIPNDNNDAIGSYLIGIEPELFRLGAQKNMALSMDLLFMQKGGTNTSYIQTFDNNGQVSSQGSMSIKSQLNYFSITPNYKFEFSSLFYLKAGPRVDFLTHHSFSQLPPTISPPENSYSFNSMTFGLSYSAGAVFGQDRLRLMIELTGQNDFTQSAKNSSTGQLYKNSAYFCNLGLVYHLK